MHLTCALHCVFQSSFSLQPHDTSDPCSLWVVLTERRVKVDAVIVEKQLYLFIFAPVLDESSEEEEIRSLTKTKQDGI